MSADATPAPSGVRPVGGGPDAVELAPVASRVERREPDGLSRGERPRDRVPNDPNLGQVRSMDVRAHPKDLPVMVAAVRERCDVLVTSNERDFRPGHPGVEVVTPGVLVQRVRRPVALAGGGR